MVRQRDGRPARAQGYVKMLESKELHAELVSPVLRQALLRRVAEVRYPSPVFATFDNKLSPPRGILSHFRPR